MRPLLSSSYMYHVRGHYFDFFSQYKTMEPQNNNIINEWDAEIYIKGNKIQEIISLELLRKSNVCMENKNVFDIGCGTGNITAKIAETANRVHGFDASQNMINYCKKSYSNTNISFSQSLAENFTIEEPFDVAISLFCLHWIKDKEKVIQNISNALKIGGDFFGTIRTKSDLKEPFALIDAYECIPEFKHFLESIEGFKISNIIPTFPTNEELKQIFNDNGFTIIKFESKTINIIIKDKNELYNHKKPSIMNRNIIKLMDNNTRETFFNKYIDNYLLTLIKNENDNYIFPIHTTIFHVKKR